MYCPRKFQVDSKRQRGYLTLLNRNHVEPWEFTDCKNIQISIDRLQNELLPHYLLGFIDPTALKKQGNDRGYHRYWYLARKTEYIRNSVELLEIYQEK